jgi:hypothetical protein
MPQGDESSYTDKQKRQAAHIEVGYEKKGISTKAGEARAWVTVNELDGTGKKDWLRTKAELIRNGESEACRTPIATGALAGKPAARN